MSKTIEDKAQEFAEINEDKKCNYSFSYNKYDIANAFQNGAEFGYALAENRIKKEYEEKLRWIPISEKKPENLEWVDCKSEVGDHYVGCYLENYGIKTGEPATITHWRSFL